MSRKTLVNVSFPFSLRNFLYFPFGLILRSIPSDLIADNIVTDEQVYYIYENQRWNPLTGFGSHGLPTDRAPWSDETGTIPLEKDCIKLPSNKWSWVGVLKVKFSLKLVNLVWLSL